MRRLLVVLWCGAGWLQAAADGIVGRQERPFHGGHTHAWGLWERVCSPLCWTCLTGLVLALCAAISQSVVWGIQFCGQECARSHEGVLVPMLRMPGPMSSHCDTFAFVGWSPPLFGLSRGALQWAMARQCFVSAFLVASRRLYSLSLSLFVCV